MIGSKVTLNDIELRLAKFLAKSRYEYAREKDIKDLKIGSQDWYETDFQGICGELAYCKLFNLYPDLEMGVKLEDCKDSYGFTYDVKTTKYDDGRLVATTKKTTEVDYFVLMTGTAPTFTYRGEVVSTDLIKEENLQSLGGRQPGYCLTQSQILKLNEPAYTK